MNAGGAIGESVYRRRILDGWLDDLLPQLPAFMLVGPRAAGKTTTAARRATSVVRLDQESEAAAFIADPDSALRGRSEPVLLDEWQVVPAVLGAVKRAVDSDPRPGRFVVTGSVRAELDGEMWPATGRFVRSVVYPMSVRERIGEASGPTFLDKALDGIELQVPSRAPDLRDYVETALIGGFPYPALELSASAREAWMDSYITDLITRDVGQLENQLTRGRDANRLRRYLEAYALNSAGAPTDSTIYEAAGINKATARAYDGLLQNLYVVEQIPAWTSNRLKRLVLQPKRYMVDAALMTGALGVDADAVLDDGDLLGRILDTFVASQLRPELAHSKRRPRLYHLRTKGGEREIDLIVEFAGGNVIGIEVKAAGAPTGRDARHLRWLRDELGDRFVRGIVFHTGPREFELDRSIVAIPIAALWG